MNHTTVEAKLANTQEICDYFCSVMNIINIRNMGSVTGNKLAWRNIHYYWNNNIVVSLATLDYDSEVAVYDRGCRVTFEFPEFLDDDIQPGMMLNPL